MIILDVRVPCTPVARLNNHRACVNGIAWAPHSSCHICTSGKSATLLLTSHWLQFACADYKQFYARVGAAIPLTGTVENISEQSTVIVFVGTKGWQQKTYNICIFKLENNFSVSSFKSSVHDRCLSANRKQRKNQSYLYISKRTQLSGL